MSTLPSIIPSTATTSVAGPTFTFVNATPTTVLYKDLSQSAFQNPRTISIRPKKIRKTVQGKKVDYLRLTWVVEEFIDADLSGSTIQIPHSAMYSHDLPLLPEATTAQVQRLASILMSTLHRGSTSLEGSDGYNWLVALLQGAITPTT